MKEETLADKIFDSKLCLGDDISKIFAKHVKEKVQNAQRRLNKELFTKIEGDYYVRQGYKIKGIIKKIFLEEFGKKLIKEKNETKN